MQVSPTESQLIANVLIKYGTIDLPSTGTSMYPLIRQGDICSFRACDPFVLKRGDIVLFFTESGQLVAHRFYKLEFNNGKYSFFLKGDTNLGSDEPVTEHQIIGKLTLIKRKNKILSTTSLTVNLWSKLILLIPTFSHWLRAYLNRKDSKLV